MSLSTYKVHLSLWTGSGLLLSIRPSLVLPSISLSHLSCCAWYVSVVFHMAGRESCCCCITQLCMRGPGTASKTRSDGKHHCSIQACETTCQCTRNHSNTVHTQAWNQWERIPRCCLKGIHMMLSSLKGLPPPKKKGYSSGESILSLKIKRQPPFSSWQFENGSG